jgi:hypothetical protein
VGQILIAGGGCGNYRTEGAHDDYHGRWTDDRYAVDFGVCGAADLGTDVLAAHEGTVRVLARQKHGRVRRTRARVQPRGGVAAYLCDGCRIEPLTEYATPGAPPFVGSLVDISEDYIEETPLFLIAGRRTPAWGSALAASAAL